MIRVKVIAPFPLVDLAEGGEVSVPDHTTVGQLMRRLRPPVYAYALPVTVNGEQAGRRRALQDGDLVVFIIPISGG